MGITVSLKEELVGFIRIKNDDYSFLERDIEIILHFFGFGDEYSPTLESTGEKFEGLTRERVRQIIKKRFRSKQPHSHEWLFLGDLVSKLVEKRYLNKFLFEELIKDYDKNKIPSKKGLINLLNELQRNNEIELYDINFDEAGRREEEDVFFINRLDASRLRSEWIKLRKLTGRDGLVRYNDAVDFLKVDEFDSKILYEHLELSKDSKVIPHQGDVYFLIEDKDNVIENTLRKIYSTSTLFTAKALARGIGLSFSKRSSDKFDYPSADVLEMYIPHSAYLEYVQDEKKYKLLLPVMKLSKGEELIFNLLKEKNKMSFPEINTFLQRAGLNENTVLKLIKSPFLIEDTSQGRKNYTYQLLSSFEDNQIESSVGTDDNYLKEIKNKLKLIGERGTDNSSVSSQRNEQSVLRDYLFPNDTFYDCGICDMAFPKSALVVAHKKKRSHCSEEERLDLDLIMPMCRMGCDFLYENGYITINNGYVEIHTREASGKINEYLKKLEGKVISEQWKKGNKYFNFHRLEFSKKIA